MADYLDALEVRVRCSYQVHEEEQVHPVQKVGRFVLAQLPGGSDVVGVVIPLLCQMSGTVGAVGRGEGDEALLAVEEEQGDTELSCC